MNAGRNDVAREEVAPFVENLKKKDGKNIWLVGGGKLLSTFLAESLVDEIVVTIAPVLLGRGIPLFEQQDFQRRLSLKDVNRFNQFVELHYSYMSS